MAVTLVINGNNYPYPEPLDLNWGQQATNWAVAVTNGMLQKSGGAFTLLADVNFGATYGLVSTYYKSRSSNIGASGAVRLARTDEIVWRNEANNADLALGVNSSNQLTFGGDPVGAIDTVSDTDSIDLTLTAGDLSADLNLSAASAGAGNLKLSLSIENDGLLAQIPLADGSTTGALKSADWTTFNSKQAAGNYITALTGDVTASGPGSVAATISSGVITNAMVNASAAIAYSKLSLTGSIVNADISASAAIAFSKLASLTSANILVGNGSNVATAVAVTGDISLTNAGVTAYSSTVPLNKGGTGQTSKAAAFDALSPMSASGDIIYGGASGTGTRLAKGSDGQVLTLASGLPVWSAAPGNPTYTAQSSTYSVPSSNYIVSMSGASWSVTLPTAVGATGTITLQHAGTSLSQVYTILTTSGQTVGGIASGSYALYTNGETLTLYSDNSNWRILNHNTATSEIDAGAVTITGTSANPTKGTVGLDKLIWYRQGNRAYCRYAYNQTAAGSGAAGTGDYLFAMPSGLTIDTTNISLYTTVIGSGAVPRPTNSVGSSYYTAAGSFTGSAAGGVYIYDSTHFRIGGPHAPGTSGNTLSGMASAGDSSLASASVQFTAEFSVPISGWQP